MIKRNFDQTPKLLQTFDQLIRSTEIRSSDPLSELFFQEFKEFSCLIILIVLVSVVDYDSLCFSTVSTFILKTLDVITMGPTITNHFNRMITITEHIFL